jgi:hypothetical protein
MEIGSFLDVGCPSHGFHIWVGELAGNWKTLQCNLIEKIMGNFSSRNLLDKSPFFVVFFFFKERVVAKFRQNF